MPGFFFIFSSVPATPTGPGLKKQGKYKGEAFWPPLQSVFAKDTAFLSAKAQNSGIRLAPNSRDNMPVFALELGGLRPDLAWGFW